MSAGDADDADLYEFALTKMAKVLGRERARQVLERALTELDIELRTAQDLLRVSERVTRLGGFEGAVGAMLGVAAVLRGATPASPQDDAR